MPSSKAISTGVPKAGVLSKSLEPFLSPTSQKDLADALDETPSADDIKNAWVNENIRDLYRAFAKGRKSTAVQYKGGVDVFDAVEGTRRDLRCVLGDIYDMYGRLAMYDRGIDDRARHCVVGYLSIRGKQTMQKVVLYVSGTEWTQIEVKDGTFPDEEDWAIVKAPVEGSQMLS